MKLFILVFSLCLSSLVSAEIYEIIDENGHKIYTDKPPLDKPDTKPISVAPQTGNSWQKDSVQEMNDQYYDQLKQKRQASEEARKRQLTEENKEKENLMRAVTAAEEALEEAKKIKAGDFLPNKNEGMHHSQEYRNRVKKAEEALNKAKEEASQYQ